MNYVNMGPMSQNLLLAAGALQSWVGCQMVHCSLGLAAKWCTAVLGWLPNGALQSWVGWPLVHGSLGLAAKWCNAVLCWLAAGALQPFVC